MVCGGAFVAALFTEVKFKDLTANERAMIEHMSESLDQNELFLKTESLAGIVFGMTGVAVVVGFIALIGRMCNVKHESSNRRVFSCLVNETTSL